MFNTTPCLVRVYCLRTCDFILSVICICVEKVRLCVCVQASSLGQWVPDARCLIITAKNTHAHTHKHTHTQWLCVFSSSLITIISPSSLNCFISVAALVWFRLSANVSLKRPTTQTHSLTNHLWITCHLPCKLTWDVIYPYMYIYKYIYTYIHIYSGDPRFTTSATYDVSWLCRHLPYIS